MKNQKANKAVKIKNLNTIKINKSSLKQIVGGKVYNMINFLRGAE